MKKVILKILSAMSLGLLISFKVNACFVKNEQGIDMTCTRTQNFSVVLDASSNQQSKQFEFRCDSFDNYRVEFVPAQKGIVSISPETTSNVGSSYQKVEFFGEVNHTTTVTMNWYQGTNATSPTDSCNFNFTVKNIKAADVYQPVSNKTGDNNYFIGNTSYSKIYSYVNTDGVIYTAKDSALTIDLGAELCGNQGDFLVIISPGTVVGMNNQSDGTKTVRLFRGSVQAKLKAASCSPAYFSTNHARFVPVVLNSKSLRSDNNYDTDFVLSYTQDGLQAATNITVNQGTVSASKHGDDSNNVTLVEDNASYTDTIPRTTWILPADNDNVVGGTTNTFMWMQYPGADGYLFEYKFPSPSFAQENAPNYENANQTVPLKNNQLLLLDDLAIIQVDFPEFSNELKQKKVETRLFVTDSTGQIITDSVASDKTTLGFE